MKLNDFNKFSELAVHIGIKEKELWDIIIGHTAKTKEVAESLGEVSGISPKTLMFNESGRMRSGFLEWISTCTGLDKAEIWHVFMGSRAVQEGWAKALSAWSGIPALAWQQGVAWMICAKVDCGDRA